LSDSKSFLWCKTVHFFHQEIKSDSPEDVYVEYKKLFKNDLSKLHLSQLFGAHLSFDHIDFTSSVFDSVVTLRSLAHCDEIDVQIAETFEKIKKLRSKDIPRFLFDK